MSISKFAYKDFMKQKLCQMQGREEEVPKWLLNEVKSDLDKMRIVSPQ